MEDNRTTARQAQGARTRADCLGAAIEVFARRGYQRTTMDEIAAAAGVTKGALYWHYGTKEEVLIAALRKLNAEWENEVVEHFEPGGRADDLLLRTVDRVVDLNLRSPWVNRFFLTVALDAANIHPDVVENMREIVHKNRWFFSALVKYGCEEGTFGSALGAADAAAALTAGYVGALVIWLIDPTTVDLRTLARAVAASVLAGVRKKTNRPRVRQPPRARRKRERKQ